MFVKYNQELHAEAPRCPIHLDHISQSVVDDPVIFKRIIR